MNMNIFIIYCIYINNTGSRSDDFISFDLRRFVRFGRLEASRRSATATNF